MPIYSTVFAQGEVAVGPAPFFTVPPGNVAIIRCVDGIGPLTTTELILSEAIANQNFAAIDPTTSANYTIYTWRGRQVFLEGMEMQWATAFPLLFARVSGYLLA